MGSVASVFVIEKSDHQKHVSTGADARDSDCAASEPKARRGCIARAGDRHDETCPAVVERR